MNTNQFQYKNFPKRILYSHHESITAETKPQYTSIKYTVRAYNSRTPEKTEPFFQRKIKFQSVSLGYIQWAEPRRFIGSFGVENLSKTTTERTHCVSGLVYSRDLRV